MKKNARMLPKDEVRVLFLCERGADRSKKAHEHFLNALKGSSISKVIHSEHAGSRTIEENNINNFDHIVAFTDEPIVRHDLQSKLAPNASSLIKIHEWTANDRLSEKTHILVKQLEDEFKERKRQKSVLQQLGRELSKENNLSKFLEKRRK